MLTKRKLSNLNRMLANPSKRGGFGSFEPGRQPSFRIKMMEKVVKFYRSYWMQKRIGATRQQLVDLYVVLVSRDDDEMVPLDTDHIQCLVENTRILTMDGLSLSISGDYMEGQWAKVWALVDGNWELVLDSNDPIRTFKPYENWPVVIRQLTKSLESGELFEA